jgi:prevent-host-death family protein
MSGARFLYVFAGGGYVMYTYARPVRDLQNNCNEIIKLANEGNQIIITQNGQEAAVVIGTKAYKEFELFLHDMYISRELAKAKEEAEDPNTKWLSEDEFWAGFEDGL